MTAAAGFDPVVAELIKQLGPDRVRTGDAIPARNRQDAYGAPPTVPRALLLPRDTADVSRALSLCHAAGAPVVVQGGMTGLTQGAHPQPGEIALSLERLRGIDEIDPVAATLTAQAGTTLAEVQKAASEAGFHCGIDLGARGSCTIGGNVATNAGGNQVLRYGMTRQNVLGLEVVLADGRVLRGLNKMLKNNAGYDWVQLFAGSEGTLGVITRVVLRLHPRPEGVQTALCALADVPSALAFLRGLEQRFGAGLITFEAMGRDFLDLALDRLGYAPPFAERPGLTVLIEVALGAQATAEGAFADVLAEFLAERLLHDAIIARSESDRARLWAYRESPYEYRRLGLYQINFDISIPRAHMAEAFAMLEAVKTHAWPDDEQVVFGHLADSNIHVLVLTAKRDAEHQKRVEAEIYAVVRALGGSVSAEHGIGMAKRAWLSFSRSAEEIALMQSVKAALDPKGILNRGRVFG